MQSPTEATDRLQAALAAAERRLALLQAAAGMGSWYVEGGSRQAQFTPETYRVLGIDPAVGPLDPAVIRPRVHPDDLPRLRADRERLLRGEPLVCTRFRFVRDDGVTCWLESRATLGPAGADQPPDIVGTVRDVSDTVRMQHELERHRDQLEDMLVSRTVQLAEARERAEAASRVKSAFLAHTSHEIRTPLNVIVSLTHLLQRAMPDPQQLGRVQAIEQAARQLSAIVDDVLDLAHADGQRAALQRPAGHPGRLATAPPSPQSPPSSQPQPQNDPAALLRQRHGGRWVLLAEDEPVNQLATMELLSDAGLLVDTANDGLDAVDMAARRRYALVLLDMRMPRLDGLSAARTIRTLPGLQATPLVALSANAFEEDRAACLAAGMNDFLSKPVDVRHLYEVLLHWLDLAPSAPAGSAAASARSREAAPAADLMAPLFGLEGVDAAGGLAAVGGKAGVYGRLLQVFADTHRGDGAELQRVLALGDAPAASGLAHRLRGSAATLGLIDVETAAAALERAIDSGDAAAQAAQLAQATDAALASTLQQLGQALRA